MPKTKEVVKEEKKFDLSIFFTREDLGLDKLLEIRDTVINSIKNRQEFESLLTKFSESPSKDLTKDKASTREGLAHWLLNKIDKAVKILENSRASKETNYFLARCYLETGKYLKAYELLAPLYKNEPDELYILLPYLDTLIKKGATEEALQLLEKVQKAKRTVPDLYYYRGLCWEYSGDYKKAYSEYKYALQVEPTHAPTIFRLAYRANLEGREEKAVELYEKLAGLRPPYINALLNLGLLYEDRSRYTEALKCYRQVLAYCPHHLRARLYTRDAQAAQTMYYNEELERKERQRKQLLAIPISDFPMSARSRTCLELLKIRTLGDLVQKTERDLLNCENFGQTSLREIREILSRKGLALTSEITSDEGIAKLPVIEGPSKTTDILNKTLIEMEWSARARSCFAHHKLYTVSDLIKVTEARLLETANFGHTTLREIKQRLGSLGLSLAME